MGSFSTPALRYRSTSQNLLFALATPSEVGQGFRSSLEMGGGRLVPLWQQGVYCQETWKTAAPVLQVQPPSILLHLQHTLKKYCAKALRAALGTPSTAPRNMAEWKRLWTYAKSWRHNIYQQVVRAVQGATNVVQTYLRHLEAKGLSTLQQQQHVMESTVPSMPFSPVSTDVLQSQKSSSASVPDSSLVTTFRPGGDWKSLTNFQLQVGGHGQPWSAYPTIMVCTRP